ncbi:cobalamin biosynthesis protein CobD [Caulobacter sp. D4A]|uniref:adenosylcobinamide-phosphate synthase CbiB n=1 Tax=unclassified Caulobacter TaxID=2648921 RepID=UPI000D72F3CD|nr:MULTISPECIES: adenosylcobinamide-phosphate synthase CbiB [unclassified Caulobacter]PXA90437.1 cobalamin biosynthesis protein CobD [Caulobacter sp. D5]PXA91670.1 cobalamin biosynthesis protein CobD [Caulobacter sp. D4A]
MAEPLLLAPPLALVIEALVGYPASLHAAIPHPVTWVGKAIDALERRWNRPETSELRRRELGVVTVALLILGAVLIGGALESMFDSGLLATLAVALLATLGLAQRSLHQHVMAVLDPLEAGDLPAARLAVGQIVGRDVEELDLHGITAAALESLAESFNDGVVAPASWLTLFGLPGLFAYKAVNTADSQIGHMEPRWRAFGWAAARTDDVVNFVPARLAGLLICLGAGWKGWDVMRRDARKHASPNAGWPEAAMAGALGVKLGGAARYDGETTERPSFGDGRAPDLTDLRRGLRIYRRSCALLWLLVALACAAGWRLVQ